MPGVVAATEPPGAGPFDRQVLLGIDPTVLPADGLAGRIAGGQQFWLVAAVPFGSVARDLLRDAATAPAPALTPASTETAFARLAATDPRTRVRVLVAAVLAAVGATEVRRTAAWDPRLQEIADLGAGLAAVWQQRGVSLPAVPFATAATEIERAWHTPPSPEAAASVSEAQVLAVEDPAVALREHAAWLQAMTAAVAVERHAAAQLARLGDAPMAARYRATLALAIAVQAAIRATQPV